MPSFDYKCNDCGHDFEVFAASLSAQKNTDCPDCKSGNTRKIFHPLNIGAVSKETDIPPAGDCSSCCQGGMCGL